MEPNDLRQLKKLPELPQEFKEFFTENILPKIMPWVTNWPEPSYTPKEAVDHWRAHRKDYTELIERMRCKNLNSQ